MRHEPCAAIRDLQHSMKLVRGHSFFAGAEQMIRKQPLAQRDVAVLEDRAHRDGERLAASATLVESRARGLALELVYPANLAAVGTKRAIGPAQLLWEITCFDLISKVLS